MIRLDESVDQWGMPLEEAKKRATEERFIYWSKPLYRGVDLRPKLPGQKKAKFDPDRLSPVGGFYGYGVYFSLTPDEAAIWGDHISEYTPVKRLKIFKELKTGRGVSIKRKDYLEDLPLEYDGILFGSGAEGGDQILLRSTDLVALSRAKLESVDQWGMPLTSNRERSLEESVGLDLKAKDISGYHNCRTFVQELTGISKIEAQPQVSTPKAGDILWWGTSSGYRHVAVYAGDGMVWEVEGWGDAPRKVKLSDVNKEYDEPSRIYSGYLQGAALEESVGGLYHLSPNKFTEFKQAPSRGKFGVDLGFHFGTEEQALKRLDQLSQSGRVKPGSPVYLYRVKLNVTSPIHIEENRLGANTASDLIQAIMKMAEQGKVSGVTDEMLDGWYEDKLMLGDENLSDISMESPENQLHLFRAFLKAIGHDSVTYENTFEGPGLSYIVFDPAQIEIQEVEELSVGDPENEQGSRSASLEEASGVSIVEFISVVTELADELGFDEPEKSYWQCSDFSNSVAEMGRQLGIPVEVWSGKITYKIENGEHRVGDKESHTFLKIGDRYYDFTASQADPSLPFPVVMDRPSAFYEKPRKTEIQLSYDDFYLKKLWKKFDSGLSESVDTWGIPLNEGLSDILYHQTDNAAEILSSNEFRLSFAVSADAVGKPEEKWFYLSTARSPQGNFKSSETLVLDGRKLGQRYSGGPIDYWGPNFRKASQGKSHEMEDRIWSRDRVIPDAKSYILEVHVMMTKEGAYDFDSYKLHYRTILKECKKAGIPVFFYNDSKAYRLLNKAKAVQPDITPKNPYPDDEYERAPGVIRKFSADRKMKRRRSYVDDLIQLYYMTPEQLEKAWRSDDPIFRTWRNIAGFDRGSGVAADISDLKKDAVMSSLAEVMRDGGFKTIEELYEFLLKKFEKVGI